MSAEGVVRALPRASRLPLPFAPDDIGNAQRLVAREGHRLRYCHPEGRWYVYDGTRWAPDNRGEVEAAAKASARAIAAEAAQAVAGDYEALLKHAARSANESKVRAAIAHARSEPGIPVLPGEFDADPWALNTAGGVLDLRTGQLREHDPIELHTKIAPVAYDPHAAAPIWQAFLDRTFAGDRELIGFVQRLAGYAACGIVREHRLPLLHGTGANGKTVLLGALQAALGDYAQTISTDVLLARRTGGATPDLARLQGARLVVASETEEGGRLAEAQVKALTGGDRIVARPLYSAPVEFDPTFTVVLATNHRPQVRGADESIWRRLLLIPFVVTIPAEERDPTLPEKLRGELPGILRWIVDGALGWEQHGLNPPAGVLTATNDYRDDEDTFGQFLADTCHTVTGMWTSATDLLDAYNRWAAGSGERPLSARALAVRLGERGYTPRRLHGGRRGWDGLGIQTTTGDAR